MVMSLNSSALYISLQLRTAQCILAQTQDKGILQIRKCNGSSIILSLLLSFMQFFVRIVSLLIRLCQLKGNVLETLL